MKSIQVISFILSCWVAIAMSGQASAAGSNRFLVVPRTVTTTVTSTGFVTSTTPTTQICFVLAAPAAGQQALAACARRRREILEQIEASMPVKVEATVAPVPRALDTAVGSEVQLASSIQSTDGYAEVVINDMDSVCKARGASPVFGGLAQAFGISVLTTSTVTASTTATSFVAKVTTSKITLACDPKAFTSVNICA